jgi:hypothetical protein
VTANYRSPDFFSVRPGESAIGHAMRIRPYLQHREDAQADAEQGHAEFRAQQEQRTQGEGYGIAGDLSPVERASALGSAGFGGDQKLNYTGGTATTAVPGQVAIQRVWASQISAEDSGPGVSPLRAHFGTTTEQWH